jgi:ABC-type branched-subunit amino acid transport system substrate-binding protein
MTLVLVVSLLPNVAQEALPDFIQHTECEQDLTGQEITIYHFGDISGSYAFITQPLLKGFEDAAEYYNARGGICGAMITTDNRDTAGDPAQTQAAYDYYKSLEPKPDLIVLYASGDAELLRSQMEADQIPGVISAGSVAGLYGEDGATPGWVYATNPLYADQLGLFCEFASGEMGMGMYGEAPTIGYISWPGAFGQSAFTAETIAYCASKGVTLLDTPEIFLPTDTDISVQVQNLVDAGANILYTNTLATGPALVAKTITDLALEDSVQLAGVNWALDTSVGLLGRTSIGSDGLPSVNGIVGNLPFRWWSERSDPAIALINELATANERQLPDQNIAYILGFSTVDFYVELYAQTVNRVGSLDAVDGVAIKETMDNIDYSPLGLYRVFYDGGKLRSTTESRIAVMYFANATMDGVATSGDDALKIPRDDGTNLFVPVVVPLTDFMPAPDLRPGMMP